MNIQQPASNKLAQALAETFELELDRIQTSHVTRKAYLAQNTLAFINQYSLSTPKLAARCKKLMVDACNYTGEYWLENGYKTAGQLSITTTL